MSDFHQSKSEHNIPTREFPLPELSPAELSRYSRHIILDQIGPDGQKRLKASRILIIGLGGLGSPAALYLAAAGVGTLGLADFDSVASHNLQRQILHSDDKVGKSKLESARLRLREINPYVQYVDHEAGILLDNAIEILSQYDVIVDGSDNFATRYLVNDAAHLAGRPVVHGSVYQYEGQVTIYDTASGGPCYRCLFPQMPAPGTVPNCEEAGVFGALCGLVGSIQALEAIKLTVGFGEPLRGSLYAIDTLNMRGRTLKLKRDTDCPLCGNNPQIKSLKAEQYHFHCATSTELTICETMSEDMQNVPMEVNVQVANAMLQSNEPPILLDVREPYELEICQIQGCQNIPIGQLGERWQALPKDKPILVLCHHGGRSMHATQFLRQHGYTQATNITGGIHQWALEVDPGLAKY